MAVNSPLNLTFTCNVSVDELNSVQREAVWEVEGRQIQSARDRTAFEGIGIFLEERVVGVVDLIITREARLFFQDSGFMVRCTAFTPESPITQLGQVLFVRTYGKGLYLKNPLLIALVMFKDVLKPLAT